jgi:hypothetical protein
MVLTLIAAALMMLYCPRFAHWSAKFGFIVREQFKRCAPTPRSNRELPQIA